MATRKPSVTKRPYFGEWDVEKRVYDALVSGGIVHKSEMQLCRELAALAGSMYRRRDLSDTEIDEMLFAVSEG